MKRLNFTAQNPFLSRNTTDLNSVRFLTTSFVEYDIVYSAFKLLLPAEIAIIANCNPSGLALFLECVNYRGLRNRKGLWYSHNSLDGLSFHIHKPSRMYLM